MSYDILFFFCHKEKGTERALNSKIASVNQYSQKPDCSSVHHVAISPQFHRRERWNEASVKLAQLEEGTPAGHCNHALY